MMLTPRYTQEQLAAQAARLGRIFGIDDAGGKISRHDLRIENIDRDTAMVTITLPKVISTAEAIALVRADPIDEDQSPATDESSIRNYADRVLSAQPVQRAVADNGSPTTIPAQHVAAVLHALADHTHNVHMLRVADEKHFARADEFHPRPNSLGRYFHALADSIEQRLQYVVCNRLLDPEENLHCEFDGPVLIDERGHGTCPWCKGTVRPEDDAPRRPNR